MKTLVITAQDVACLLNKVGIDSFMDCVIQKLEQALIKLAPATADIRKREGFNYFHPHPGILEWMPIMEAEKAVVKMVGYNPMNPELYSIPTIISTISQYDIKTGCLIALVDGVILTAIRTGAASAIASRVLARENSKILGLVGCGSQAVTQLHALSRVFNFEEVLVYDIDPQALSSFVDRVNFTKLKIQIVSRAVLERNSDIICTSTSVPLNAGPVINDDYLKNHIHINAVGSDLPGKIELPLSLLKRSFVCPDFIEQAKVEGECQQLSEDEYGPELSVVLKNKSKYYFYRNSATVFDSTGYAIEDQVIVELIVDLAKDYHVGNYQQIESLLADPKNPYGILNNTSLPITHLGASADIIHTT